MKRYWNTTLGFGQQNYIANLGNKITWQSEIEKLVEMGETMEPEAF